MKRNTDLPVPQPLPKRKGKSLVQGGPTIIRSPSVDSSRSVSTLLSSRSNASWIFDALREINGNYAYPTKQLWHNETTIRAHQRQLGSEIVTKRRVSSLELSPARSERVEVEDLVNEVLDLISQFTTIELWLFDSEHHQMILPPQSPKIVYEDEDHPFMSLVHFGQALYISKSSSFHEERANFTELHHQMKRSIFDYTPSIRSMDAEFVAEAKDWVTTSRQALQPGHLLYAILGFSYCMTAKSTGNSIQQVVEPEATHGLLPLMPSNNMMDTEYSHHNDQGYRSLFHPIVSSIDPPVVRPSPESSSHMVSVSSETGGTQQDTDGQSASSSSSTGIFTIA